MKNSRLLVCDLDNTLYDWIGYFVPSFTAMVDAAVDIMGCDREQLLDDLRDVHRRHHDSEHPFALLETATVRTQYKEMSLAEIGDALNPALHAFNSTRLKTLKLNPGVSEGLAALDQAGVLLIAHTESKLYGAVDRLERLGILKHFRKIYCRERPRSKHPRPDRLEAWLNRIPMHLVRELANHQAKPDPKVLLEICAAEGIAPRDATYVGDSIARDVLMAKRAGVFAIWAEYGARHDASQYEALVRVSHWTAEEVAREKRLNVEASGIRPDYVAHSSFLDVLEALEHEPAF
jgi:phosphoglycolate phosphatase